MRPRNEQEINEYILKHGRKPRTFTAVRHTICRWCGLDIEGHAPYRSGEWCDRGSNTRCPGDIDKQHQPYNP